jgi:ribose transport system permease protein
MEAQHRQGLLSRARGSPWTPVAALVALCAGFGAAEPRFLSPDNARVIAESCAVPVILAVGMSFVALQGALDLSLEGVMALCSLVVAMLVLNSRTQLDLGAPALVLAVLPGLCVGALNGLVATRLGVPPFMATLGTWSAALGVAMLLSGGAPPLVRDPALRAFGLGRTGPLPNLAVVAAGVLLLGHVLQQHTRFGRCSLAIGGGEGLARQAGLPVDRCKVLAFACSGLLAGVAGVLETVRLGIGHVDVGANRMLATVTAAVIGGTALGNGRGGALQCALGALLLTVLADGMIFVGVAPEMQKAVQGLLILAASLVAGWHLRRRGRFVP